jgi:hypothetical protein
MRLGCKEGTFCCQLLSCLANTCLVPESSCSLRNQQMLSPDPRNCKPMPMLRSFTSPQADHFKSITWALHATAWAEAVSQKPARGCSQPDRHKDSYMSPSPNPHTLPQVTLHKHTAHSADGTHVASPSAKSLSLLGITNVTCRARLGSLSRNCVWAAHQKAAGGSRPLTPALSAAATEPRARGPAGPPGPPSCRAGAP